MLANFFDIQKKARIFLPDFKSNLVQIDERMYAKEFEDSYDQVLCYGISFYKKRCLVKKIHSWTREIHDYWKDTELLRIII